MDISQLVQGVLFFVLVLIPSLTIHEYAHALASVRLGDITPKLKGRLTLNPIVHIDPIGTIALPLMLSLMGAGVIGRAKPVPINPHAYRKPIRDEFIVAMAGPLSNIVLGISLAIVVVVIGMAQLGSSYGVLSMDGGALQWIALGSMVNFSLALFNLIPVPPLDGYRIITLIAPQTQSWILQNQQYVMIGLFLVMMSPLGGYIGSAIFGLSQSFFGLIVTLLTGLW